jgi:hypothetical protein
MTYSKTLIVATEKELARKRKQKESLVNHQNKLKIQTQLLREAIDKNTKDSTANIDFINKINPLIDSLTENLEKMKS